MATLIIDGTHHEIEDAFTRLGTTVEESDQRLRDALRSQFDIIANATIRRETREGKLLITVIKQPATKGVGDSLLERLLTAPDHLNGAYVLDCVLRRLEACSALDFDTLVSLQPRIQAALDAGRDEERRMTATRTSLLSAPAVPSSSVPLGF